MVSKLLSLMFVKLSIKYLHKNMQKFLLPFFIIFTSCFNGHEIKNRPVEASILPVSISTATKNIYDFKVKDIDGTEVSLTQYKGKKIVILNVASKCGFTPQYADWEKFYVANKNKVVVLGFPCNQFLGQESGDNATIKSFCQKNYGVTFPMFEKLDVKGTKQAPIYKWLTDKSQNGWNDQVPTWNFCKYLISKEGKLLSFFASNIKPTDKEFLAALK